MNFTFTPILAAADWVQIVIGVIVVIFWLIGQLAGVKDAFKPKKPPRRPPARPQGQQPPRPAADQAAALRGEVEEFLRRAQGQPAKPQPKPPQRQPKPVAKQPPRRLAAERQSPSPQDITIVQPAPTPHVHPNLAERSSQITDHSSHLGAEVGLADEKLEAHLEQTFEHRLGSLKHIEAIAEIQAVNPVAVELLQMLSSPQGMRQAVIASEILKRRE